MATEKKFEVGDNVMFTTESLGGGNSYFLTDELAAAQAAGFTGVITQHRRWEQSNSEYRVDFGTTYCWFTAEELTLVEVDPRDAEIIRLKAALIEARKKAFWIGQISDYPADLGYMSATPFDVMRELGHRGYEIAEALEKIVPQECDPPQPYRSIYRRISVHGRSAGCGKEVIST